MNFTDKHHKINNFCVYKLCQHNYTMEDVIWHAKLMMIRMLRIAIIGDDILCVLVDKVDLNEPIRE